MYVCVCFRWVSRHEVLTMQNVLSVPVWMIGAIKGVDYNGRNVHVGTFPIGIDADKFLQALDSVEVRTICIC